MIIRFHAITIAFFLDISSNKYMNDWDHGLVKKKAPNSNEKLRKKPYMSIGEKPL